MTRNALPTPDVSDYIARVSMIARSTRQLISNSTASKVEGAEFVRKTMDTLQASYDRLAAIRSHHVD